MSYSHASLIFTVHDEMNYRLLQDYPPNMFLRGTWVHIEHHKHSQASIPMNLRLVKMPYLYCMFPQ
jgi:hypothetical protein